MLSRRTTSFREETLGSTPNALTPDAIKTATNKFDTEIVFTLTCIDHGLTKMSGLECCSNLVSLDLSRNSISRIEGLDALSNLRTLTLVSNCIAMVENIRALSNLQALYLQDNKLDSLNSINLPLLCQLPQLTALCFQNIDQSAANPVCFGNAYQTSVLHHLPGLKNLDGERYPKKHQYTSIAASIKDMSAQPLLKLDDHMPSVPPWLQPDSLAVTSAAAGAAADGTDAAERADWECRVLAKVDDCIMLNVVLKEKMQRAA